MGLSKRSEKWAHSMDVESGPIGKGLRRYLLCGRNYGQSVRAGMGHNSSWYTATRIKESIKQCKRMIYSNHEEKIFHY